MKVSIITRTTGRDSLKEVIRSVESQTYKNIEHIIVRDLDRFHAAAEGFLKASGDVLLLFDDDDVMAVDHVEKAVEAFKPGVMYVNTGFSVKAKWGGKDYFRVKQGSEWDGKKVLFTHSCCFFFKRELLEQYNYLDDRYHCPCEDAAFYADIARSHYGVFTGAYSATYILHGENTSGLSMGQHFNPAASKECLDTVKKIIHKKEN